MNSSIRHKGNRWFRCACAVALCAALSSCVTGPDYKRPNLRTPAGYKSSTAQEAADPKLASDWWALFNDPDLNALEEQALAANLDLQAAMARVSQARASAASVRSGFYPVVTMDPSATRSRRPGVETEGTNSTQEKLSQLSSVVGQVNSLSRLAAGGTGTTGTGLSSAAGGLTTGTGTSSSGSAATTSSSYSIPFDFSYEIDIWGRVRRSYESAQAQATASDYDLEVVRQTLLADVAQNYFNLRSLDAQEQILAKNLDLYKEQVELTQQKFKAGLSSETDRLQATVQLESAQADLEDTRRQREDTEHALAILLGQAPADFSFASKPLEGTPPTIPAGLPADILRRRPDVAEAEQNLVSANAEIGVAQAEFFPTVKLTGSAGFESSDIKNVLDWKNRVWSFGPNVSVPIFEGGKLKANLQEKKARYDELEATYKNTVLAAFGDVEDSLTDLHRRAGQAESQARALDAAREYHRLTQIEYNSGITDYLKLVDAEQTLLNNELTAAKILNERMVSTVLLVKAIGSGWDTQFPKI
jgi:multidrug efflux system outer membrane protein